MPNHVSLRARKAEIFRDLLVTVVFVLAIDESSAIENSFIICASELKGGKRRYFASKNIFHDCFPS